MSRACSRAGDPGPHSPRPLTTGQSERQRRERGHRNSRTAPRPGQPPSATHLQEELDQVQVKGLLPAVALQQAVHARFQKHAVVDSVQPDARLSGTWRGGRRSASGLSLGTSVARAQPPYLLVPADVPPSGER